MLARRSCVVSRTHLASRLLRCAAAVCLLAALTPSPALALLPDPGVFVPPPAEPAPPPPMSLKTLAVPVPSNLDNVIVDKAAAVALGKALFWDMQVGSDGVQACASCHFHAGADNRTTAQLNPGDNAGDSAFSWTDGSNRTLSLGDFPFHKLSDPAFATSTVLADTNDIASSQGVLRADFSRVKVGYAAEWVLPVSEPVFQVAGSAGRQVPARNTPSAINAVFNVHNFWDGRAHEIFNGENPFGPADPTAGVFVDHGAGMAKERFRMRWASLASQAVGPIASDVEMRAAGRSRAALARKMYSLRPLGEQMVHPNDSVLGPLSRARLDSRNQLTGQPGLRTWYPQLVESAFKKDFWQSTDIVKFSADGSQTVLPNPGRPLADDEFTQMEANFPLIFGVSVMLYEATLVSDDAPFDRFREGDATALTSQQKLGFNLFVDPAKGRCVLCHGGPEFTNATQRGIAVDGRIELMSMLATGAAFYDVGYYNIGVRPQTEDGGRGGDTPFLNPVTGLPMPLSDTKRGLLKRDGFLTPEMSAETTPIPPGNGWPDPYRTDVVGAFKTPSLRNVELTGPYFHNGGAATLKQAVEFYERGSDFGHPGMPNFENLPPLIRPIVSTPAETDAIVAFLLSLTDDRVRYEQAPFDHPQLFLPDGRESLPTGIDLHARTGVHGASGFSRGEIITELPAVGGGGRLLAGLPPIQPFLSADPFQP